MRGHAGGLLRSTRATPPGRASSDEGRRDLYGAALTQYDQLIDAAVRIRYLSRPLLLYYAVHQAGKAIAAAWAHDNWHPTGHGLAQDGDADPADVLRFRVKPSETGGKKRGPSVFATVASILDTGRLTGTVELGALWSALPDAPPPPDSNRWRLALPVQPQEYDNVPSFSSPAFRGFVCLRGQPELTDPAAINAGLANYPDAAGAAVELHQGILAGRQTQWGTAVPVRWPIPAVEARYGAQIPPELAEARVVRRVPIYPPTGDHWLVPVVGEGSDHLPPVLLWWTLLFALSLLARYEPAAWRAALDLDKSPTAFPLRTLLDQALEVVPELLYEAATQDHPGQGASSGASSDDV